MIVLTARRFTLALVLGVFSLATVDVARAQGATKTSSATPAGNVTGTDPMPPTCGCKPAVPSSSVSSATTSGSNAGAMAQALLVLLGLA